MENFKDLEYQKVFVCLDGTEQQRHVLKRAAIVAANNHAELVIGHVVDVTPFESFEPAKAEQALEAKKSEFRASISDALKRIGESDQIPSVEVVIERGRIRETLKDKMLDAIEPDMVVCGARGLSSIKYALLGSISTFLLRNCDCDILVVK